MFSLKIIYHYFCTICDVSAFLKIRRLVDRVSARGGEVDPPGVEGVSDGDLVDRKFHQRKRPTLATTPTVREMGVLPQQSQATTIQ